MRGCRAAAKVLVSKQRSVSCRWMQGQELALDPTHDRRLARLHAVVVGLHWHLLARLACMNGKREA